MNKYLVAVYHYFRGYENLVVEASNKIEAIEKANNKVKFDGGNYSLNKTKVIRKCKK